MINPEKIFLCPDPADLRIYPIPKASSPRQVIFATWPGAEVDGCYSVLSPAGSINQVVYFMSSDPKPSSWALRIAAYVAQSFCVDVEFLNGKAAWSNPMFQEQVVAFLDDDQNTLYVPSIQSSDPYARMINQILRHRITSPKVKAKVVYYLESKDAAQVGANIDLNKDYLIGKVQHLYRIKSEQDSSNASMLRKDPSAYTSAQFEHHTPSDVLYLQVQMIGYFKIETDRMEAVQSAHRLGGILSAREFLDVAIGAGSQYTRIEYMPPNLGPGSTTSVYLHKL